MSVQVPAFIDRGDQRGSCRYGPVDRDLRRERLLLQFGHLAHVRFERLTFLLQRQQRALVLLDSFTVEPIERRGSAIHATDRPQVIDVEQQSPVTRLTQLVQIDQAMFDFWSLRIRGALEGCRARARRRNFLARPTQLAFGIRQFLRLQLAVDFELPQVDEQRTFLRGKGIGFLLQRANSLRRPFRRGVSGRLINPSVSS